MTRQAESSGECLAPYLIYTKRGTSTADFKHMCAQIDNDQGVAVTNDGFLDVKVYGTHLTAGQAKNISITFEHIVESMSSTVALENLIWTADAESGNVKIPADAAKSHAATEVKHDAHPHQKLISAPRDNRLDIENDDLPPYRYDERQGSGQTIYIVDAGCTLSHPELGQTADREVRLYIVPYKYILGMTHPDRNLYHWHAESIGDSVFDYHGTKVAMMAAGLDMGIAPRAESVCVKVRAEVTNRVDGTVLKDGDTSLLGLYEGLSWIRSDVVRLRKMASNRGRRFVVNLSIGFAASVHEIYDPAGVQ